MTELEITRKIRCETPKAAQRIVEKARGKLVKNGRYGGTDLSVSHC